MNKYILELWSQLLAALSQVASVLDLQSLLEATYLLHEEDPHDGSIIAKTTRHSKNLISNFYIAAAAAAVLLLLTVVSVFPPPPPLRDYTLHVNPLLEH